MYLRIEMRLERTTRPVFTGSRAEVEREDRVTGRRIPTDRPSLARTRLDLPLVRDIRAVG